MAAVKPPPMAVALTASAQLIESLRLERDVAQAEAAELREQLAALDRITRAVDRANAGLRAALAEAVDDRTYREPK